jgi:hypothetical protein
MEADKMATKTGHANIGDIIRSEKFAYGMYGYTWNPFEEFAQSESVIEVDGKTEEYPVKCRKPGTPWDAPSEYIAVDRAAYDPSRGKAQFVVEKADMQGGGRAMFNDYYPDGWHVTARRLNDDRSYNPKGEIIQFYQSGCFTTNIGEVELVGMKDEISAGKPDDIWHNRD